MILIKIACAASIFLGMVSGAQLTILPGELNSASYENVFIDENAPDSSMAAAHSATELKLETIDVATPCAIPIVIEAQRIPDSNFEVECPPCWCCLALISVHSCIVCPVASVCTTLGYTCLCICQNPNACSACIQFNTYLCRYRLFWFVPDRSEDGRKWVYTFNGLNEFKPLEAMSR